LYVYFEFASYLIGASQNLDSFSFINITQISDLSNAGILVVISENFDESHHCKNLKFEKIW